MSDANPAVSVVMIVVSRSPPPAPGWGATVWVRVVASVVYVGPGAPPVAATHCAPASHGSGCGAFWAAGAAVRGHRRVVALGAALFGVEVRGGVLRDDHVAVTGQRVGLRVGVDVDLVQVRGEVRLDLGRQERDGDTGCFGLDIVVRRIAHFDDGEAVGITPCVPDLVPRCSPGA